MKIIIVGAGAIGLLYAVRLARAGEDVLLLTRSIEQSQALLSEGLRFVDVAGTELVIPVAAQALSEFASIGGAGAFAADFALLTVKQPSIREELLSELRRIIPEGAPLLALQNGIGHLEPLADALPLSAVYAAITTEGALRADKRSVIHTGAGQLTFGAWTADERIDAGLQKMLLQTLIGAGIEANLSNEMKDQVFLKLLINAVINPLTALYQVKNGELPQDPFRLRIMRALHDESLQILLAAGLAAPARVDLWERLLSVCAATAANESSMLRDVRAGRPTEIGWINGGIVRYAERYRLPSRMNAALLALVEALTLS